MTTKKAKTLYKKAKNKPRYDGWCTGAKWNITMLGKLAWLIPGNRKIMDGSTRGYNTKFNGVFHIIPHRRFWELAYDLYNSKNSWWVRRIKDKVRFINADLAIGRFYYCGVPLGWFIMERIIHEKTD